MKRSIVVVLNALVAGSLFVDDAVSFDTARLPNEQDSYIQQCRMA